MSFIFTVPSVMHEEKLMRGLPVPYSFCYFSTERTHCLASLKAEEISNSKNFDDRPCSPVHKLGLF